VYLSLSWTMWTYRVVLRMGCDGWRRRHVERVGQYASALMPVATGFLGLAVMGWMVMTVDRDWLKGTIDDLWKIGVMLSVAAALIIFCVPTVALLRHTGRGWGLRGVLMFTVFPVAMVCEWFVVWTAVFWVTGYAVVAVASIVR
jgi:hypothetical protein